MDLVKPQIFPQILLCFFILLLKIGERMFFDLMGLSLNLPIGRVGVAPFRRNKDFN
jgi:hypothetical protein